MLKISQKLEYAIRAMIELAERRDEDTLVPAREIAERQQIPLRFLEQQLGSLSRAGLVESFRGAGGGCRIAADPASRRCSSAAPKQKWPRCRAPRGQPMLPAIGNSAHDDAVPRGRGTIRQRR